MKRSAALAGIGIFAVIFVSAGGLYWHKHHANARAAAGGGGFEPVEAVQVVAAREIEWTPMSDLIGTTFSLRSVRLSNEVPGVIQEVRYESGAIIEAGQPVVILNADTDTADLLATQAAVRVAEANTQVSAARLALAQTELRRIDQASRSQAASEMELERARSVLAEAQADRDRYAAEVDLSKARAAQVQTRIDKLSITAPFRARAGLRLVHEGQFLPEGTPIVNLEEVADRIYLDFAIPQDYAVRVQPGRFVMATIPGLSEEPTRIEVVALDASVNTETRNVRVRAVIQDPQQRLRPGMFIQIRVPTDAPSKYVAVPTTAIRRTPYADQVFVVVPAEAPGEFRASQRFVRLGPTSGGDVIVLEGLKAGDQVAATGSFKLRDGAKVMNAPPGEAVPGTHAGHGGPG